MLISLVAEMTDAEMAEVDEGCYCTVCVCVCVCVCVGGVGVLCVMAAASYLFPEIANYLQMLQSTFVKKNVSEPTRVYYRWKSLFRITG